MFGSMVNICLNNFFNKKLMNRTVNEKIALGEIFLKITQI